MKKAIIVIVCFYFFSPVLYPQIFPKIIDASPEAPTLLFPINDTTVDVSNPLLQWSKTGSTEVDSFRLQIYSVSDFCALIVYDSTVATTQVRPLLFPGAIFSWSVTAINAGGVSPQSQIGSFRINFEAPLYSDPSLFPFHIGDIWYYSAIDTQLNLKTSNHFTVRQKIVDTLFEGKWRVEIKNQYSDSLITKYDSWQYYDGGFCFSGWDMKCFDNYLKKDYYTITYLGDVIYDSIGNAQLFGKIYESQSAGWTNQAWDWTRCKTAKYIGVFYYSRENTYIPSQTQYTLTGAVIDGVVYGDTLMTAIQKNENPIITKKFELCQNYPNPFNPSTTMSYEVPVTGQVSLKLFDILGNEVMTLVNQIQSAGHHELNVTLSDLPSNVYVYRLQQNNNVQSRKLILLK